MARRSAIDAATAQRLDLELHRNGGNARAAARELGLDKDAVARYVARQRAAATAAGQDYRPGGPAGPTTREQLLAIRADLDRLRAAVDALLAKL